MKGIFGSGTRDFLIIRFCALIMVFYTIYLLIFFVSNPILDFHLWYNFFHQLTNKILFLAFIISFAIHLWIGTWAIGSDYLTKARLGSFGPIVFKVFRLFCAMNILLVLILSLLIIF